MFENSSRQKRSSDNRTFSGDEVYILPGYPKQVSKDPPEALLAFFLQFPQGFSDDIVPKEIFKAIIESDVSSIEASLGGTIMSIQPLISTTVATVTTEESDKGSKSTGAIIGACVAVVLLLVIIVVLVLYCKRRNR